MIVKKIQDNLGLQDDTVRFLGIWDVTLKDSAATASHLHENDEEVYYVIEGTGRLTIGDEERKATAGDVIYSSKKIHIVIQSDVKPIRFITVSIDLSEAAGHGVAPTYIA